MAKETKNLVIKKLGWKRICKNTQRFGWVLDDAYQHEETTVTTTYTGEVVNDKIVIKEDNQKSTKVRVHLSFIRDRDWFVNFGKIRFLEIIYNIIFFFRRVLAFLLPIASIAALVVFLFGKGDILLDSLFGALYMAGFFVWIAFIIIENILARIAYSKMQIKED